MNVVDGPDSNCTAWFTGAKLSVTVHEYTSKRLMSNFV